MLRHFYTTDATIEALVSILERAPGVSIVRDEIISFLRSMDQYRGGKGDDRQQYLSLHNSSNVKKDRRVGEPIYITHPVACLVGGIQTDMFSELHSKDGRRDGLLDRFIPIRPNFEPQRWSEDDVDPRLLDQLVDTMRILDSINMLDSVHNPDGLVTQMHSEARNLWINWHNENADLKDEAEGMLQGFYSKLTNHVARFALILNLAWNPNNPNILISADRMRDAIALGEWCRENIHSVLPLLGSNVAPKIKGVRSRILRILNDADDEDGWISRGDILKRLGNVQTESLQAALDYMLNALEVEKRIRPDAKTKPAEQWRIFNADRVELSNNSNYPHPLGDSNPIELSNYSNNLGEQTAPNRSRNVTQMRPPPLTPTGTDGDGWESF